MQKRSKSAFSLIELSIVILIIGVLVIGIAKGSRIIKEARLKSATSLTISSPAASLKGLVSWWEASSKTSFANSIYPANGDVVTSWLDANPQADDKNNLTGSGVIFVENAINGLPAINLNGTSDYLESNRSINADGFTYIVALKFGSNSGATIRRIITANNFTDGEVHYNLYSTNKKLEVAISNQTHSGGDNYPDSSVALTMNQSYIISVASDAINTTHYINGATRGTANVTLSIPKKISPMTIGAFNNSGSRSGFFEAQIGEIIIFNRKLTDIERKSVEQYLSQKYGIKVV